jgi:hypothetical protein
MKLVQSESRLCRNWRESEMSRNRIIKILSGRIDRFVRSENEFSPVGKSYLSKLARVGSESQ